MTQPHDKSQHTSSAKVAYSVIFAAIAAYAEKRGVRSIGDLPGCWEFEPGPGWWIAVNGRGEPTKCSRAEKPIEPFHAYIEWNGWPAGIVSPRDGVLAAGTEANEAGGWKACSRAWMRGAPMAEKHHTVAPKPRLLIYGITAEQWTARWGIEAFTHPCYRCGAPCTTSIPFVQGTLRGLQAPLCPCGHPQPPYVVVRDPAHGDLFAGGLDG